MSDDLERMRKLADHDLLRDVPWNFVEVADTPDSATMPPPLDWRRPLREPDTPFPTLLEALSLPALLGVVARDLSYQVASNLIRRWANR